MRYWTMGLGVGVLVLTGCGSRYAVQDPETITIKAALTGLGEGLAAMVDEQRKSGSNEIGLFPSRIRVQFQIGAMGTSKGELMLKASPEVGASAGTVHADGSANVAEASGRENMIDITFTNIIFDDIADTDEVTWASRKQQIVEELQRSRAETGTSTGKEAAKGDTVYRLQTHDGAPMLKTKSPEELYKLRLALQGIDPRLVYGITLSANGQPLYTVFDPTNAAGIRFSPLAPAQSAPTGGGDNPDTHPETETPVSIQPAPVAPTTPMVQVPAGQPNAGPPGVFQPTMQRMGFLTPQEQLKEYIRTLPEAKLRLLATAVNGRAGTKVYADDTAEAVLRDSVPEQVIKLDLKKAEVEKIISVK